MAAHGATRAEPEPSAAVTSASRGWLTLAAERPQYLEMAVDMALSLRAWSPLPVVLAADAPMAAAARSRFPDVFADIVPIEARFLGGRARKYGIAAASPFDETVFVDADCLVIADPAQLWTAAGPGPLTFVGDLLSRDDDAYHHGFATRALMRRFALDRYLKVNSGVLHLRRDGAAEAMEECLRCWSEEIRPALESRLRPWRFLGDELAFGVVGGRRRFDTFGHPGPMYWAPELRALDPQRPTKPILHFIAPVPRATLETLLAGVRDRRRAAGLEFDLPYQWWRRKARQSGLGWVAQQVHRRMVGRPA